MHNAFQIKFLKGETFEVEFQYQTVNADGTRTPINITGKVVSIYFRLNKKSTDLLVLASNAAANAYGSVLTVTNAVLGKFKPKVTNEQTALDAFTAGKDGSWWVMLDDGTDPIRLWKDEFVIREINE